MKNDKEILNLKLERQLIDIEALLLGGFESLSLWDNVFEDLLFNVSDMWPKNPLMWP